MRTSDILEVAPFSCRYNPRYITGIHRVHRLSSAERESLRSVAAQYAFRANDYYLQLIDWNDPNDPIRQLIIPRMEELEGWGDLDASVESDVTVEPGVQHKYPDTVLLLCNSVCAGFCRYCF